MIAKDSMLDKELTFTRFDHMSERYPDKTAVLYLGERFSYTRLGGTWLKGSEAPWLSWGFGRATG